MNGTNAAGGATAAPARRWYREPMVWLLAALPLASVVATFALIRAGGDGRPLDSAPEPVQRSAQVQQRDLAADRRALELGLVATAKGYESGLGRTVLGIDGAALPHGDLLFDFVHPLQADGDQRRRLVHDGGRLVVAVPDPAVAWHLRLAAASGEWRLVGRWDPTDPRAAIALGPALGAVDAERR